MSKGKKIHKAWFVFAGVCIFNLVGYGMIVNCFGTFLLPTSTGLNISVTEVSLTHTVRTICGTLGSLVAGQLIHKVNLKRYLACVCVGIASAAVFTSLSTALWQLLASAAVLGLSVGMGVYTLVPLVIPQWFRQPEGYIGFATACGGAGGILFAPVLTGLMSRYGWQAGYYLIIAAAILVMLPIAVGLIRYSPADLGIEPYDNGKRRLNTSPTSAIGSAGATMQQAIKTPAFYLIILFFVAVAIVSGAYTHLPSMLRENGYTTLEAGYLYSFYQMGAAGAQFLIGLLSIKLNIKRTVHLFMCLILAGITGIGFFHPGFVLTAILAVLVGSGRAVGVVAGPILVRNAFGPAHYNKIFSCLYTAYLASVAAATTLYGLVYDLSKSYYYIYVIIIVCCVVTMISAQLSTSTATDKKAKPWQKLRKT